MLKLQGGKIEPTNDNFPSLLGKQVEVNETTTSGSRFGQSFVNMLLSTVGVGRSTCLCSFSMRSRYRIVSRWS
jgi:hypothetical protein